MLNNENMRVVKFRDLWEIFLARLWIMILAASVVMSGAWLVNSLTFRPKYESTATLYILQRYNNDQSTQSDYNEFSLALKVVNDCTLLLKSHSVLDTVIDRLNLDMSYRALYNSVTITNPDETRILQVRVESDDPVRSREIVNAICTTGTQKITDAMGFEQVNFYEYGIYDPVPCNKTGILSYLLLGMLAAIVVYVIFLICYLADDRIHTEEDIAKYLGLSVLGDIPNSETPAKKRYGYKYYRRNKYYVNRYGEEK